VAVLLPVNPCFTNIFDKQLQQTHKRLRKVILIFKELDVSFSFSFNRLLLYMLLPVCIITKVLREYLVKATIYSAPLLPFQLKLGDSEIRRKGEKWLKTVEGSYSNFAEINS